MEKKRVKKGERYYIVGFNLMCCDIKECYDWLDNIRFSIGNYFYTREEAESMARKLSAVFKGADVIEMPSEEDIHWASRFGFSNTFSDEFKRGVDWLKSKIVK